MYFYILLSFIFLVQLSTVNTFQRITVTVFADQSTCNLFANSVTAHVCSQREKKNYRWLTDVNWLHNCPWLNVYGWWLISCSWEDSFSRLLPITQLHHLTTEQKKMWMRYVCSVVMCAYHHILCITVTEMEQMWFFFFFCIHDVLKKYCQ